MTFAESDASDPWQWESDVAGRRSAIEMALAAADGGSVVAVLGKGHEQGQLIGTTLHDFDDVVETARAWQRLTGGVEE